MQLIPDGMVQMILSNFILKYPNLDNKFKGEVVGKKIPPIREMHPANQEGVF